MIRELQGTTVCSIDFAADPQRKDALVKAVEESVAKFIKEGPNEQELANYRTEFAVQLKQMQKENRYWNALLLLSAKFDTPLDVYLSLSAEVEKLRPEKVREVARVLFGGDRLIAERLPQKR